MPGGNYEQISPEFAQGRMFWYNVRMKDYTPEQDVFEYDDLTGKRRRKPMGPLGYGLLALLLLLVGAGAAAAASRGMSPLPERVTAALAEKVQPSPPPPGGDAPGGETPGGDAPGEDAPGEDAPAPEAVGGPEQEPINYERTAFLVDGTPIGVLASREAAESALAETLAWFELQILGGGILETELENEIAFAPAAGAEAGDITADELFALLTGEDSPLSVRSTLTEEIVAYTEFKSVTEEDDALLEGTRIIVRYGTAGETHTITTRTFVNGVEEGEAETVTATAREAVYALVRQGTEKVDPEAEPGRREGEKGRDADGLEFRHPTEKERVESYFGQREGVLHLGMDYSGDGGEDVFATCAGTVVSAIERGGYGLMVEIDHGDGFVTRYAHLQSIAVSIGDTVAAGDVIGALGGTGNAVEPHLHFELRIDGIAFNPRYYID